MTKKAHCQLCLDVPEGIEGHQFLASSTSGPSQRLLFKCEKCDSRWAREYAGSGQFVWIDLSDMLDD
jgi:hypothetical protein